MRNVLKRQEMGHCSETGDSLSKPPRNLPLPGATPPGRSAAEIIFLCSIARAGRILESGLLCEGNFAQSTAFAARCNTQFTLFYPLAVNQVGEEI